MNRDEYMPKVLAALDAEPESRLAISVENLGRADDARLIGLDLVRSYARTTDPATLTGEQATDVARFRPALDLGGHVLLAGKTYGNLPLNVYDLAGRFRALADARIAISLERLDREDIGRAHVREVRAWVKAADLSTLTGQLADDAWRIRRATEILADRILIGDITFWNLQCNIGDLGGSIFDFATSPRRGKLSTASRPPHQAWLKRSPLTNPRQPSRRSMTDAQLKTMKAGSPPTRKPGSRSSWTGSPTPKTTTCSGPTWCAPSSGTLTEPR